MTTNCNCDTFTASGTSPALTAQNTGGGEAIFATTSANDPAIQANNTGSNWNGMGVYATAGGSAP